MHQEFDEAHGVQVNRDDQGVVREILHTDQHVETTGRTAQLAAAEYLATYGPLLGVGTAEQRNALALAHEAAPVEAGDELRFYTEQQNFDMTTVTYQQTHFGLPVWHGGVSIHMKGTPYRVVSSQSTRHADVDVRPPTAAAMSSLQALTAPALAELLGLPAKQNDYDLETLAIENVRLVIYRYGAAKRARVTEPLSPGEPFSNVHPPLALPPVAAGIEEGRHYVAAEVHFALAPRGRDPLHWLAVIEAETRSVLYVRPFADSVNGMVFQQDPVTTNGGPAPNATTASLNVVRTAVALAGLVPPAAGAQALTGNNVRLVDVETPAIASPTRPGATDFSFDSRTNGFAAVNAYYHCDSFFRLVQSLGFDLSTYFGPRTLFPNVVDHRGRIRSTDGIEINAHCVGTSGGLGIQQTTFALADLTDTANPLGLACDRRVVLHELGGHGVLYNFVHSPNFGFAHSAGDSIAVITCDPDSQAPDRFLSFPWVAIGRRHDRAVAAGWGWNGNIARNAFDNNLDRGGYNNEQILSTTLFRFYRSIGGDSANLPTRQFAARYAVYLILRAISSLSPVTNPSNAAGFATALINADLGDWTTEGHAGGAYGKVIRWAFEKQGLFQLPGTAVPNNLEGASPPVDVYIEDGRHGEYQYQPNHWSCQAIWNRRHPDNGTAHEEPVVGATNFAYVKIKNRGRQVATNVVVKAFHADPAAGLTYPNDWQPMNTAQLAAPDVPPNSSAEVMVGPFEWVPAQVGHACMLMIVSAAGDPSNISNLSPGDAVPEWRLVPHDNNIAQRNVSPVAGGGGRDGLLASLSGAQLVVKNPHGVDGKVVVNAVLPRFLADLGWKTTFTNPGADSFGLKSGESKTVTLKLVAGQEFAPAAIKPQDDTIRVEAVVNGIVVGGMTYVLDPASNGPAA